MNSSIWIAYNRIGCLTDGQRLVRREFLLDSEQFHEKRTGKTRTPAQNRERCVQCQYGFRGIVKAKEFRQVLFEVRWVIERLEAPVCRQVKRGAFHLLQRSRRVVCCLIHLLKVCSCQDEMRGGRRECCDNDGQQRSFQLM